MDELFEKMAFHLKIKWEYREKSIPVSRLKIQGEKIVFPSKQTLEKLFGFANQYEYQNLEEQLKIIKKEDPRFLSFVEKIQLLAEDYRMSEIIVLLQKNMEDKP